MDDLDRMVDDYDRMLEPPDPPDPAVMALAAEALAARERWDQMLAQLTPAERAELGE